VNAVHIFDASALIACFRAYQPVYRLLTRADAGEIQLVWPAAAIAEANAYLRASHTAWSALLMGVVTCTELTEQAAVEVGLLCDRIATGHVVYEARATQGVVVTQEPSRYQPWTLPLLVL
jgi:hypothetical protein